VTDFGRRKGDMKRSVYDDDHDGVITVMHTQADMETSTYDPEVTGIVADARKLEMSTKAEVRDHTPKAHTHTESQITDLDHNALKVVGVPVDDTDKGAGKVLAYNSISENLEYETQTGGGHTFVDRGDPAAGDFEAGTLTTDDAWNDLDLSGIVAEGAAFVYLSAHLEYTLVGFKCRFREKGNLNEYNILIAETQGAGVTVLVCGFVKLDGNRKIEYRASDCVWDLLRITVRGWIV